MRIRGVLVALAVGALVLCLGSPSSFAQFSLRGSISGIVSDPSAAVMPDATVTLRDLTRNQVNQVSTNAVGLYTFSQLTDGPPSRARRSLLLHS